ncbi:KaiC [Methanosarcina sp. 2.H.T.1A.6]|uniref:RAD55 family ATPase n=1 Tax=unclassified Methanosarcina TaxID=2644672 RepID=UPI0006218D17|nr:MULTISPECIES: RAD55 family ATPase [unclassified Methanosarcina]KKG14282.1 KaiC [Methanosarcina sp. 2.H.T.1A.3]KKG16955.1 KaiC [Methanosarcina sp. 2.H.T.1A.15]KKG19772.1 KaiC [Methanosarcina sp. 2.H.T.1A.6]KKG27159.1 KaiC [Methanosarcina sp. 2.H.T.1A.8]
MKRISSGIPGFDDRIGGGYLPGRVLLITGDTGTGKTTFTVHFLHRACLDGKKCVLVATEELPEDILELSEMMDLGLTKYYESGQLTIEKAFQKRSEKVQTSKFGFTPEGLEIDLPTLSDYVPEGTDIVVIDNIGVFTLRLSIQDFRDQFDALNFILSTKAGCTSMFVMDDTALKMTHNLAEYSVSGSLRLMVNENPYTGNIERYIRIPKMRRTCLSLNPIRFEITSSGIKLL